MMKPMEKKKAAAPKRDLFEDDFGGNKSRKAKVNPEELEETKEYCETHYFKQIRYSNSTQIY
jgi:hypothetical protein